MQVIEAQRPWFWCLTITSIKQIRMFAKADRGAYLYGVAGSREWRDLDRFDAWRTGGCAR